jgi:hypothetical protein
VKEGCKRRVLGNEQAWELKEVSNRLLSLPQWKKVSANPYWAKTKEPKKMFKIQVLPARPKPAVTGKVPLVQVTKKRVADQKQVEGWLVMKTVQELLNELQKGGQKGGKEVVLGMLLKLNDQRRGMSACWR